MKPTILSAVVAASLLAGAICSYAIDPTEASGGSLEKKDVEFVTEAAQGGMLEVLVGQLAEQKSENPAIKKMGAMLVKDHGKANVELKEIATNKGVTMPVLAERKSASLTEKLAKKEGEDFDKAFVEELEKDHKNDIEKFEKASQEVKDPELRAFATKSLPVLRMHLEHLQELKAK